MKLIMPKAKLIIASLLFFFSYQNLVYGQDVTQKNYAYYSLEPEIVTNFLGTSARKLGFVRVSIELMLEDAQYLEAADHHSPLIRSAIIEVFGRQTAEKIKSLTGREDIRRNCLARLKELMRRETGSEMIKDVIFTKYLYHQG
ncbi:flagellar basal body-associated protein FliL [Paraglaciecola sp. L3A3]|uniref:flagellar basal body-associated protein FliL n=1 Tax=Paraglaciecola sp. L3A3 TaxID=2686358 RepID=UPI00131AF2DD|nr:flagellar basal body-associated protein FliL [Paraglaciecola sp. L3A3]